MLRILHVYRTFFPDSQGGLEETIRQICQNTRSRGVENRLYTLSRSLNPRIVAIDGVEVHRFPLSCEIASCGFSISGFWGYKALSDWADVIHYHFPWPFADVLHLFHKPKKPFLITYHSDIVRQKKIGSLYKPLMHLFLNRANAIVATSDNYLNTSKVLRFFRNKVEIIPLGLDRKSYPQPEPAQLKEIMETVGKGFFLFIGVLRYYKGLHILLEAVRGTELTVVIAGSGPVEQELKKRAIDLDLQNVIFLGHVSDPVKVALLELAKAVVFPSCLRSEAFGVTLLEAAMYGKPMISTEIGTGTSFVNCHDKTGLVVPPLQVVPLREAMLTLEYNPEKAQCMGKAALRRFEELFTAQLMGERYFNLYRSLDLKGNTSAY